MRCRRIGINPNTGEQAIVFFGSVGKDSEGHAIFYDKGTRDHSYVPSEHYLYKGDLEDDESIVESIGYTHDDALVGHTIQWMEGYESEAEPRVKILKKVPKSSSDNLDEWNTFVELYRNRKREILSIINGIDRNNNYAEGREGVAVSLTQRLRVLQNELWWAINLGWPIAQKSYGKQIWDTYLTGVIQNHPSVLSISAMQSSIVKHVYRAVVSIQTRYGDIDLEVSEAA